MTLICIRSKLDLKPEHDETCTSPLFDVNGILLTNIKAQTQ